MFKVTLKLQRYFVIYIRSPLKMQKIIKYLYNLSVTLNIFLAFHNLFMMLVHMEVHLKGYLLMRIQSKF